MQRAAIITGGGQGIGKCMAGAFLRAGYAVLIAEVDAEAGEETAGELAGQGPVAFQACDVADEAQVNAAVEAAVKRFGRLDVLVNNAAISAGGPIEELSRAEWDRVLAVNLTGPFLFARAAAAHLRKGGGCILNIASTRAFMSEADTEAYSASKGGIVALTHALAVSLGPAIRVNAIAPGWIDTGPWKKSAERTETTWSEADRLQHPAGRVGEPRDIAQLALYLASEDAGFITGACLVADGGMTRKMIYV